MKQWWLAMALLLSVGINIGILLGRSWPGRAHPDETDTTTHGGITDSRHSEESQSVDSEASAPPWADRAPRFVGRMATELGLTGEERERFIERQVTFFKQTLAARTRVGRLQNELRRELMSDEPDRQRIDKILEKMSEAHTGLERVFVDNLLATREILDPEQQRRYLQFLQRIRRGGDDVRRRLQEEFQSPRQGPPGGSRQGWRPRRPAASPPDNPPPSGGP